MKTAFQIFTLVLCTTVFSACAKNSSVASLTKEEQVARLLSGSGNKVWNLKSIKVNNVAQTLTASQSQYKKSYTLVPPQSINGQFTDYDNYSGDWTMQGAIAMQEVFQQIGGGYGSRDYVIVSISDNALTMYYVANNSKIEETYYAY